MKIKYYTPEERTREEVLENNFRQVLVANDTKGIKIVESSGMHCVSSDKFKHYFPNEDMDNVLGFAETMLINGYGDDYIQV